jgi:hypothetical protein
MTDEQVPEVFGEQLLPLVRSQLYRDLESAAVTERLLREKTPPRDEFLDRIEWQHRLLDRCQQRLEFLQRQKEPSQSRLRHQMEDAIALAAAEAGLPPVQLPNWPEPRPADLPEGSPEPPLPPTPQAGETETAWLRRCQRWYRWWSEQGQSGSPEPRPKPAPPPPPDEAGPLHAPRRQWHWLRRPPGE